MKKLSLALCGLILAAASSTAALADTLTFEFSFSGPTFSGEGMFTATSTKTAGKYLITDITGTTDTGNGTDRNILLELPAGTFGVTGDNDNFLFYPEKKNGNFFSGNGVSYELDNGAEVNLYDDGDALLMFVTRATSTTTTVSVPAGWLDP